MAGPIHVTECGYLDPVAAFTPFAAEPFSLLFDSALKDPDHGRYAFIAADPFQTLEAKDGEIRLGDRCFRGDPFLVLGQELARYPQQSLRDVPPFQGGAAGFFGYDLCHHLEKLSVPPLGISALYDDDLAALNHGIALYDGLYAWARQATNQETEDQSSTRSAA